MRALDRARVPARPRSRGLAVGVGVLAAIGLLAVAAPAWPEDPDAPSLRAALEPPSGAHWLGTDGLGRDVLARLLHGARVSLGVGLLSAALALAVGIPLGAAAGYAGGTVDAVVGRLIEAVLCFPTILLLLALLAAPPAFLERLPPTLRLSALLGLTGWVAIARFVRGEVARLSGSDLVTAARSAGAGHTRVLARHVLPASLGPVLVTSAFAVAGAISAEAALSFLGLGIAPPTPSWGGMLAEARTHVSEAWWLALFPGLALFATLLACNLIGDGLRDRLDPRTHERA